MKHKKGEKLHRGRDHPVTGCFCHSRWSLPRATTRGGDDKRIKIIALVTFFTFTLTSVAWPVPPVAPPLLVESTLENELAVPSLDQIKIPDEFGVVEEIYQAPQAPEGSPLVVYLQDAHCIYEAQTNIRKIIDTVQKDHALGLVAIEGGDKKMDPLLLRAFPVQEIKEKVIDDYVRRGELSGADYAAIVNERESDFWGIEDMKVYGEDKKAFLKAIDQKPRVDARLEEIARGLERVMEEIASPELKELYRKTQDYEAERLDLLAYVNYLTELGEAHLGSGAVKPRGGQYAAIETPAAAVFKVTSFYPTIASLLKAVEREKAMKMTPVENQAVLLSRELERTWKNAGEKEALEELKTRTSSFLRGETKREHFYIWLLGKAKERGVLKKEGKQYSLFLSYIDHVREMEKIKGDPLFKEIDVLNRAIKEKLFRSDKQRALDTLLAHLKIITNLSKLELSREELKYYSDRKAEFAETNFWNFIGESERPSRMELDSLFLAHQDFYRIALKRDETLHQNFAKLLSKAPRKFAMILTGGFHTEGIKEKLKADGVSYMVVFPRITKFDEKNPYWDVMRGNVSYAEFIGKKALSPADFLTQYKRAANEVIGRRFAELVKENLAGILRNWETNVRSKPDADPNFLGVISSLRQSLTPARLAGLPPEQVAGIVNEVARILDSYLKGKEKEAREKIDRLKVLSESFANDQITTDEFVTELNKILPAEAAIPAEAVEAAKAATAPAAAAPAARAAGREAILALLQDPGIVKEDIDALADLQEATAKKKAEEILTGKKLPTPAPARNLNRLTSISGVGELPPSILRAVAELKPAAAARAMGKDAILALLKDTLIVKEDIEALADLQEAIAIQKLEEMRTGKKLPTPVAARNLNRLTRIAGVGELPPSVLRAVAELKPTAAPARPAGARAMGAVAPAAVRGLPLDVRRMLDLTQDRWQAFVDELSKRAGPDTIRAYILEDLEALKAQGVIERDRTQAKSLHEIVTRFFGEDLKERGAFGRLVGRGIDKQKLDAVGAALRIAESVVYGSDVYQSIADEVYGGDMRQAGQIVARLVRRGTPVSELREIFRGLKTLNVNRPEVPDGRLNLAAFFDAAIRNPKVTPGELFRLVQTLAAKNVPANAVRKHAESIAVSVSQIGNLPAGQVLNPFAFYGVRLSLEDLMRLSELSEGLAGILPAAEGDAEDFVNGLQSSGIAPRDLDAYLKHVLIDRFQGAQPSRNVQLVQSHLSATGGFAYLDNERLGRLLAAAQASLADPFESIRSDVDKIVRAQIIPEGYEGFYEEFVYGLSEDQKKFLVAAAMMVEQKGAESTRRALLRSNVPIEQDLGFSVGRRLAQVFRNARLDQINYIFRLINEESPENLKNYRGAFRLLQERLAILNGRIAELERQKAAEADRQFLATRVGRMDADLKDGARVSDFEFDQPFTLEVSGITLQLRAHEGRLGIFYGDRLIAPLREEAGNNITILSRKLLVDQLQDLAREDPSLAEKLRRVSRNHASIAVTVQPDGRRFVSVVGVSPNLTRVQQYPANIGHLIEALADRMRQAAVDAETVEDFIRYDIHGVLRPKILSPEEEAKMTAIRAAIREVGLNERERNEDVRIKIIRRAGARSMGADLKPENLGRALNGLIQLETALNSRTGTVASIQGPIQDVLSLFRQPRQVLDRTASYVHPVIEKYLRERNPGQVLLSKIPSEDVRQLQMGLIGSVNAELRGLGIDREIAKDKDVELFRRADRFGASFREASGRINLTIQDDAAIRRSLAEAEYHFAAALSLYEFLNNLYAENRDTYATVFGLSVATVKMNEAVQRALERLKSEKIRLEEVKAQIARRVPVQVGAGVGVGTVTPPVGAIQAPAAGASPFREGTLGDFLFRNYAPSDLEGLSPKIGPMSRSLREKGAPKSIIDELTRPQTNVDEIKKQVLDAKKRAEGRSLGALTAAETGEARTLIGRIGRSDPSILRDFQQGPDIASIRALLERKRRADLQAALGRLGELHAKDSAAVNAMIADMIKRSPGTAVMDIEARDLANMRTAGKELGLGAEAGAQMINALKTADDRLRRLTPAARSELFNRYIKGLDHLVSRIGNVESDDKNLKAMDAVVKQRLGRVLEGDLKGKTEPMNRLLEMVRHALEREKQTQVALAFAPAVKAPARAAERPQTGVQILKGIGTGLLNILGAGVSGLLTADVRVTAAGVLSLMGAFLAARFGGGIGSLDIGLFLTGIGFLSTGPASRIAETIAPAIQARIEGRARSMGLTAEQIGRAKSAIRRIASARPGIFEKLGEGVDVGSIRTMLGAKRSADLDAAVSELEKLRRQDVTAKGQIDRLLAAERKPARAAERPQAGVEFLKGIGVRISKGLGEGLVELFTQFRTNPVRSGFGLAFVTVAYLASLAGGIGGLDMGLVLAGIGLLGAVPASRFAETLTEKAPTPKASARSAGRAEGEMIGGISRARLTRMPSEELSRLMEASDTTDALRRFIAQELEIRRFMKVSKDTREMKSFQDASGKLDLGTRGRELLRALLRLSPKERELFSEYSGAVRIEGKKVGNASDFPPHLGPIDVLVSGQLGDALREITPEKVTQRNRLLAMSGKLIEAFGRQIVARGFEGGRVGIPVPVAAPAPIAAPAPVAPAAQVAERAAFLEAPARLIEPKALALDFKLTDRALFELYSELAGQEGLTEEAIISRLEELIREEGIENLVRRLGLREALSRTPLSDISLTDQARQLWGTIVFRGLDLDIEREFTLGMNEAEFLNFLRGISLAKGAEAMRLVRTAVAETKIDVSELNPAQGHSFIVEGNRVASLSPKEMIVLIQYASAVRRLQIAETNDLGSKANRDRIASAAAEAVLNSLNTGDFNRFGADDRDQLIDIFDRLFIATALDRLGGRTYRNADVLKDILSRGKSVFEAGKISEKPVGDPYISPELIDNTFARVSGRSLGISPELRKAVQKVFADARLSEQFPTERINVTLDAIAAMDDTDIRALIESNEVPSVDRPAYLAGLVSLYRADDPANFDNISYQALSVMADLRGRIASVDPEIESVVTQAVERAKGEANKDIYLRWLFAGNPRGLESFLEKSKYAAALFLDRERRERRQAPSVEAAFKKIMDSAKFRVSLEEPFYARVLERDPEVSIEALREVKKNTTKNTDLIRTEVITGSLEEGRYNNERAISNAIELARAFQRGGLPEMQAQGARLYMGMRQAARPVEAKPAPAAVAIPDYIRAASRLAAQEGITPEFLMGIQEEFKTAVGQRTGFLSTFIGLLHSPSEAENVRRERLRTLFGERDQIRTLMKEGKFLSIFDLLREAGKPKAAPAAAAVAMPEYITAAAKLAAQEGITPEFLMGIQEEFRTAVGQRTGFLKTFIDLLHSASEAENVRRERLRTLFGERDQIRTLMKEGKFLPIFDLLREVGKPPAAMAPVELPPVFTRYFQANPEMTQARLIEVLDAIRRKLNLLLPQWNDQMGMTVLNERLDIELRVKFLTELIKLNASESKMPDGNPYVASRTLIRLVDETFPQTPGVATPIARSLGSQERNALDFALQFVAGIPLARELNVEQARKDFIAVLSRPAAEREKFFDETQTEIAEIFKGLNAEAIAQKLVDIGQEFKNADRLAEVLEANDLPGHLIDKQALEGILPNINEALLPAIRVAGGAVMVGKMLNLRLAELEREHETPEFGVTTQEADKSLAAIGRQMLADAKKDLGLADFKGDTNVQMDGSQVKARGADRLLDIASKIGRRGKIAIHFNTEDTDKIMDIVEAVVQLAKERGLNTADVSARFKRFPATGRPHASDISQFVRKGLGSVLVFSPSNRSVLSKAKGKNKIENDVEALEQMKEFIGFIDEFALTLASIPEEKEDLRQNLVGKFKDFGFELRKGIITINMDRLVARIEQEFASIAKAKAAA